MSFTKWSQKWHNAWRCNIPQPLLSFYIPDSSQAYDFTLKLKQPSLLKGKELPNYLNKKSRDEIANKYLFWKGLLDSLITAAQYGGESIQPQYRNMRTNNTTYKTPLIR